jgi:hypothetical protein
MEEYKYNDIFYGCYQGNHEKQYKWQCKMFETPQDATNYTYTPDKQPQSVTVLIPINKYVPIVFHNYLIKKSIHNFFKVDIN